MYKLVYSDKSIRDLRKIDTKIRERIIQKIKFFAEQKNPLWFATKLKRQNIGDYRFRVGDYRVIFDIDETNTIKILFILRIKHRKEIYDDL